MKKYSKRTLLANTFGTLGYLCCLFSWAWVGLLYLPMLLENEHVESFLIPEPSKEVVSYAPSIPASPLTVILAVAITVVILIVTIVVFLRAPITVAKTGKTVTTKAADSALPLITKGHKLPPAKKRLLTASLIKAAKLLLVLVPVAALAVLNFFVAPPLSYDIVIFSGSVLALIAVLCFSTQYISARFLKVAAEALV